MNIQGYLKERGVDFEPREHPPAFTAQEVAAEEHVSGNMLAKAVTVKTDHGYAMCVLPATFKLDMQKVAKAMKAKNVRLADEDEMAKLYRDSEVGAEPPFGNLYNIPMVVDEHLANYEEIVFQAGTHRHAVRMKLKDYMDLTHPTTADIAIHM